ncbi:hypothetical protein PISS_b0123 [Pseudoalteromonas issachenkonii]|uniref:Uncharacterized protein n=1 Tax=Pseudoalteromonas issachenkonii TaxID=152297 RepID=A0ABM6N847_9GAMM|nr:hypothetical protein PISS_b0123 [Pseudoalteromonas issachenkonii]
MLNYAHSPKPAARELLPLITFSVYSATSVVNSVLIYLFTTEEEEALR